MFLHDSVPLRLLVRAGFPLTAVLTPHSGRRHWPASPSATPRAGVPLPSGSREGVLLEPATRRTEFTRSSSRSRLVTFAAQRSFERRRYGKRTRTISTTGSLLLGLLRHPRLLVFAHPSLLAVRLTPARREGLRPYMLGTPLQQRFGGDRVVLASSVCGSAWSVCGSPWLPAFPATAARPRIVR